MLHSPLTMQMKTLRARWITTVAGVGLVGTAAVTLVAVSVSLFMANLTVRGWLNGEAINIRGHYDQQLLARFRETSVDAARDLIIVANGLAPQIPVGGKMEPLA